MNAGAFHRAAGFGGFRAEQAQQRVPEVRGCGGRFRRRAGLGVRQGWRSWEIGRCRGRREQGVVERAEGDLGKQVAGESWSVLQARVIQFG